MATVGMKWRELVELVILCAAATQRVNVAVIFRADVAA